MINRYSEYLRLVFGEPVQKISIDSGSSCPNRDGTLGRGGCSYCNMSSIQPGYMKTTTGVRDQLKKGIDFFSRRNRRLFLAYFQSYTSTYGDADQLIRQVEEAVAFPSVCGIVLSTRPDCIPGELMAYLQELSSRTYVSVEFGIESTDDETLRRINRCHSFMQSAEAVRALASRGIPVGGHLILGFPWENEETMLLHARRLSRLPLTFLKIHHLQILKHTSLAREYTRNAYALMNPRQYLELVTKFVELLPPGLVIQRFLAEAPLKLLLAPHWGGLKNAHFTTLVERELQKRDSFQGKYYEGA